MDKSDKKGKEKDDPDKKRDRKSPSTKHSTPTNERPKNTVLGKCIECGHMGNAKFDCMQCEGAMEVLGDLEEDDSVELGFDFSEYRYCQNCCDVQLESQTIFCRHCIQEGCEKETVEVPGSDVERQLKEQKGLPRCALPPFHKCKACFKTAEFLGNNMPVEINMADNILSLCRAYDALVECGYNLSIDKKQHKKTKFLFQ